MNICFICTGNTCRSPMAEGILRSKGLAGISVRSAGVYAADGLPISVHSQTILEENEMPYTPLSRRFTQQDAEWADLILTMTASHRDTLQHSFESQAHKIFTVKEYIGEWPHDVIDPYGGDSSVYEQTFQELARHIDRLAQKVMEEQR